MQPTTMLPKLKETTQTISFGEDDETCGAELYSTNVVVSTNAGKHTQGSSKIKLKQLICYNWPPKFYPGHLVALHMSGKIYAYSIIAGSGPNAGATKTANGIVRVGHTELGIEQRALIKGMKGEVQDIAFAHIQNQVVLACIDELGNFYIHEIEVNDNGLSARLTAEVREDTGAGGSSHRVVWCPYIPDEEDDVPDEDVARLLLTTHANQARMWNIRAVEMSCAGTGWVSASEALRAGAGRSAGTHGGAVTAAAFSPDGTALATVAADGYVMFAQVYMNNESSPRCLHKWQPHDGKPLSSLFFLDNHKDSNADVQFWKFAVTGAENNTSIKIWSCKSWSCLQSISFSPALDSQSLGMNAMLDTSASYLLLSDFLARSLYVLSMARDSEDSTAYCKSISQFLLCYPVLSFCIIDAEEINAKCESRCNDPFHSNGSGDAGDSPDDYDVHHQDGNGSVNGGGRREVRVRLFIVDTRSLQEAELVYEPPAPADRMLPLHDLEELTLEDDAADESSGSVPSTIIQQQTQQLKNLLMRSQTQPGSLMGPRPESPSSLPPPLNLMTPDAFSSPGKREDDDPPLSATPDISNKSILSAGLNEEVPLCAENKASGGSSPSREVREIMGHNDLFTDMEEDEEPAAQTAAGEEQPATEAVVPASDGLVPTGQLFSADLFTSPEKPPPPAKLTHANSDTSWPQISIAQITEANQRKASSEKSSTQSLNAPLMPLVAPSAPPPPPPDAASVPDTRYVTDEETKQRLHSLEDKLDNITELLSAQQRLLSSLRSEQHAPRALLEESAQRTAAAVDAALTGGWDRIARMAEAASTAAATAAGAGAARKLEPLASALQHELASKLSATDRLLRDNIDKLANSKTIMERLSTAIAQSLSEMVQESFRDALCKSVVPVMEKALTQIFRQINQAFQNGTKEFTANTEAAARAAAERGGAAGAASLCAALERHAELLAQSAPLQPKLFAAQIQEVVHGVLEKEVSWWREQTRSMQMSRAHSPAHSVTSAADRKMQVSQIQALIASGDINGAFQYALSASDLSLVVAACWAVEPARVFGPPCRLKQHVLLSLVQQLAADMANDTLLKQRYLEEAVMNLDTTNPVTREHLPAVIRELKKQITAFLSQHPSHALTRQFRMLLMATEALVKTPA